MAIFRNVKCNFWRSVDYASKTTPEQKLFHIYLRTTEDVKQTGIIRTRLEQIALDLGYDLNAVKKLVEIFEGEEWVIFDPETLELALTFWPAENLCNPSKNILACVKRELLEVRSLHLLECYLPYIKNRSFRELFVSEIKSRKMKGNKYAENNEKTIVEHEAFNTPSQITENQDNTKGLASKEKERSNKEKEEEVSNTKEVSKEEKVSNIKEVVTDFEKSDLEKEKVLSDPDVKELFKRLPAKHKSKIRKVVGVIDCFRQVTGKLNTKYYTNNYFPLICHWLEAGYSINDFCLVFEYKTAYFQKHGQTEHIKLDTYLRKERFEGNLEAAQNWKREKAEEEVWDNVKAWDYLKAYFMERPKYIAGIKKRTGFNGLVASYVKEVLKWYERKREWEKLKPPTHDAIQLEQWVRGIIADTENFILRKKEEIQERNPASVKLNIDSSNFQTAVG